MSRIVYLDGKFVKEEQAKISVFDHCLLYGDGVFEGIRLYKGCVFRLREHLQRLYDSAHALMLEIPVSMEEMTWIVVESCRRNKLKDGYIRLVVTRGLGTLGLAPWLCPKASVICIAGSIQLYPKEYYTKGLEICTVPTRRNHPEVVNPRIKSCNYLNNIMAKIEAHNNGCIEALMLDANGYVAECTGDNVFILKDGVLYTPPTYVGALKGITRDCIMEVAEAEGITVKETPITRFDVFIADEMFLTGTAAEAIPVVMVDKRKIGSGKPGAITLRLIEKFHERTSQDGEHLDKVPKRKPAAKK
ncbi:branched-chain-amino-acid transaminase [Candidatus Sumerlaeota bacterium]|nr:branched-chain-amino-acid transaminase [Candidatus Sumerlaeota bacterium]